MNGFGVWGISYSINRNEPDAEDIFIHGLDQPEAPLYFQLINPTPQDFSVNLRTMTIIS
jgi:hypothetical protein